LVDGLAREGLSLLRWPDEAERLRQRLGFLHRKIGAPWPDMDDDAVLVRVEEWLPELDTARRRADLARIDTTAALRRLLPWPQATRLDELAPDRIEVPSGSRIRVDYGSGEPVLAVKLQET